MVSNPKAREAELIVEELGQETLVYDLRKDRAHCLNPASAWIWKNCDGHTGVAELTRSLSRHLGSSYQEHLVWHSLEQLARAGLLQEPIKPPLGMMPTSRRQFALQAGKLALLVPVVTSITAPLSAQILSCTSDCSGKPDCTPCTDRQGRCRRFCCRGRCRGASAARSQCKCGGDDDDNDDSGDDDDD